MQKTLSLMRREWLQHRFGWMLAALLPLALAVALTSFGQVELDDDTIVRAGEAFPLLLAMAAIAVGTVLIFSILSLTSGVIVSGLPRRDHADRSLEFWLSVPVSHVQSLAVPMVVHLLIVPAVALVVGLLGGYVVSLVLVSRIVSLSAWLAMPWGDIVPATLALTLRLLLGLPLATLWLAPLILLVMLLTAWFRRWGWVILLAGLGLGGLLLKMLFGQPFVFDLVASLLRHAGDAMVSGNETLGGLRDAGEGFAALRQVPAWAVRDLGYALRDLLSPLLVGGLLFAAACFALLVQWRQRGGGVAGA